MSPWYKTMHSRQHSADMPGSLHASDATYWPVIKLPPQHAMTHGAAIASLAIVDAEESQLWPPEHMYDALTHNPTPDSDE